MRIESSVKSALKTAPRPAAPAPSEVASGSFERGRDVDLTLAAVPDVRAEAVARGRALISDPNYPSPRHLRAVADLLADQWSR